MSNRVEPLREDEVLADFYEIETMVDGEEAIFFHHGPLDQWWPCEFAINGVMYTCAEQWMMAQKATLFKDGETLERIMGTSDPAEQKAMGREVKGFDPLVWMRHCRSVVYEGNVAKFVQSQYLHDFMISTNDATLVEASQEDQIWGIGVGLKSPNRLNRRKWQGRNWLGECLMASRFFLVRT